MKVHSIRVARSKTTDFPFDRVYLVAYADKRLLSRLFAYAIVIPLQKLLRDGLKDVVKGAPDATFFGMDRFNMQMPSDLLPLLESAEPLLLALPLRGHYVWKASEDKSAKAPKVINTQATANYLHNSRWSFEENGQRASWYDVFDNSAGKTYLQTPEGDVEPVCMACPQHMLHMAGRCQLGQKICLDNLPLSTVSRYKKALSIPEPAVLSEAELAEMNQAEIDQLEQWGIEHGLRQD